MSPVLLLVLSTAFLHAGWNAVAKSIDDRWVASLLIGAANAAAGLAGVVLLGVPDRAAWPFLVTSAVLQTAYLLLLTRAYAHGEMSRLYPMARGTSPVVVTAVAVLLLGERLSALSWIGIAVLIGALAVLTVARGRPRAGSGVGLAVLTGLAIASYTLVDGTGVRRSGDPLGYIAWLFLLHGPLTVAVCSWRRGVDLFHRARRSLPLGLTAGLLSVLAYGIVVWAQSRAPLALVAALRETSVVWAVLIARVFLAERLVRREVVAIVLAAAGAAVLQLGGA